MYAQVIDFEKEAPKHRCNCEALAIWEIHNSWCDFHKKLAETRISSQICTEMVVWKLRSFCAASFFVCNPIDVVYTQDPAV